MKKIVIEKGTDENGPYSAGAYEERGHYVQVTVDRSGIHVRVDMLHYGNFRTQKDAENFIKIKTEKPL